MVTPRVAGLAMSLLRNGAEGKGLAIDVAVTSPLAATYVRHKEPCEWYAATQKHGKYDVSFAGTDYLFSAVVFETLQQCVCMCLYVCVCVYI